MRYGFCTGFAAGMTGDIDHGLVRDIAAAGYDYVEFPMMQIAALSDPAFNELVRRLADNGLGADCTCNMFPPHLRLTGPQRDWAAIERYLDGVLPRLVRLGTRKIVLGSSGARDLPAGTDQAEGYDQMQELLEETVLPATERYGILIAVEPINHGEANFICTLPEGMEVVRRASHPRIRLLADTIHMLWEGEDPAELLRFRPWLEHFHISEAARVLPVDGYTPELSALLDGLRKAGPTDTVSFETRAYSRAEMARALSLLKERLE